MPDNYSNVDFTVAEDVDGGRQSVHSLVLSPQHCVGRLLALANICC